MRDKPSSVPDKACSVRLELAFMLANRSLSRLKPSELGLKPPARLARPSLWLPEPSEMPVKPSLMRTHLALVQLKPSELEIKPLLMRTHLSLVRLKLSELEIKPSSMRQRPSLSPVKASLVRPRPSGSRLKASRVSIKPSEDRHKPSSEGDNRLNDYLGPPPQTPEVPPPPHEAGEVQVPHSSRPPHPLPAGPQLKPSLAHVVGVQGPASLIGAGSAQYPSMQEMPVDAPQQSLLTAHLFPSTAQPGGCVPQTSPPSPAPQ
jgi:hypothetical protein